MSFPPYIPLQCVANCPPSCRPQHSYKLLLHLLQLVGRPHEFIMLCCRMTWFPRVQNVTFFRKPHGTNFSPVVGSYFTVWNLLESMFFFTCWCVLLLNVFDSFCALLFFFPNYIVRQSLRYSLLHKINTFSLYVFFGKYKKRSSIALHYNNYFFDIYFNLFIFSTCLCVLFHIMIFLVFAVVYPDCYLLYKCILCQILTLP